MTMISSNINWYKNLWIDILKSDAKGYYAYLPAIFIYKDVNFGFFEKIETGKYYNKNLFYDYRKEINGKYINKYYCGTAIAQLPFFLIAHLSSYLFNYDIDGYSKLYLVLINIGALFYLLIGLFYLNSILNLYEIKEKYKSLVLFATVFGTNLFYYTVAESGMSHVYSFAFITMFIFYAKRYFITYFKKYILFMALLLGIIVLIRPINGLILLVLPFAAWSLGSLKKGLTTLIKHKLWLLFSLIAFLIIISIQLTYYKIATGHFIVYSYGEEDFNFLKPHIINILFSYKKGLFLYTPMYLISFAGCYYLWKSSKFEFYSWISFFIIITYIFSSWWIWFYGGSFSSRVFIEYISLFMILLGIALKNIKLKYIRTLYVSLILTLIIICQIQTYQYRYYIIHYTDMTKEKYWNNFLRIDKLINE